MPFSFSEGYTHKQNFKGRKEKKKLKTKKKRKENCMCTLTKNVCI